MRKKLTKGIISFIVTLAMTAAVLPVIPAMADDTYTGTIDGTNITWTIEPNGNTNYQDDPYYTLTLSGVGPMVDYEDSTNAPWYNIRVNEDLMYYSISEIVIGEGITHVGNHAFSNYSYVTNLSLPNSLESIGDYAFYDCYSINNKMIFPTGLKSIGNYAFYDCNFQYVMLPDGLKTLGNYAFCLEPYGRSMAIPASIGSLGEHSVAGTSKDGGPSDGLMNIYYSGTKEQWDEVSKTETDYGTNVDLLYESTGVTWDLDEETGVLTINGKGKMGNFVWTPWLDSAEAYGKIVEVVIDDEITSIGAKAFFDCRNLEKVNIPDGVTEIGDMAFYDCGSLERVTLPAGLKKIGYEAFAMGIGVSQNPGISKITLPEGLVSIGEGAFSYCDLRSITIPSSVTEIGAGAFDRCYNLTSAVLSPGVSVVGKSMFQGCSKLSEVTLPATITEIGAFAFNGTALESIDLPDGLKKINANVFNSCRELSEIVIPDGVTEIGESAFENSGLKSIVIPGNVTTIGDSAFSYSPDLASAVISECVKTISAAMFQGCGSLASVDLPTTLESIKRNAFDNCTSLATVYYEGSTLYSNGAWDEDNISGGNDALTALTPSEKIVTLTYDAHHGANAPAQQTAKRRELFTISSEVPTRAGYTFLGWTDVKNGREVKYEAGDTIEAYSDITLYAVWSADFVVSIPEEDLSPKIYDTVSIPVSVTDNKGFATLMLSVKYDKTKFELAGADVGALAPGAAVTPKETADGANILIVSNSDITGSGEVVTVKLTTTVETLNTSSDITVTPTQARNTANPNDDLGVDAANDTESVVLTVSGDATNDSKVDSGDVLVMSRYCAQYQNHGMTSEDNADVYTDGIVNIKDVYVLSQYVTAHPSLSSISLMNAPIMPMNTDKPEIKGTVAKVSESDKNYIDVTLSVENNTGFTGFNFALGFDKTKLKPVSITNGDLTSESLVSNINEDGVDLSSLDKVTAFWIGSAVTGDGDLYTVRFEELTSVGDDEQITFTRDGFTNGVDDINALFPSAVTVGGQNISEELDIVFDTDTVRVTGDASGQLIVAGYDENGNLVKAVAPQSYEQPLTEFAGCDSVKAFLWNSLGGMEPVCESKSK